MKTARTTPSILAIALLCLMVSGVTYAKTPATPFPAGDQSPATLNAGLPASEYGYHPEKDSSYGETWYFLAVDEAGNQIWVLMSVNNYRPFAVYDGTVDLFYYGIDGKSATGHLETKKDGVKGNLEKVDINIGGNTVKGAYPDYDLNLSAGNVKMNLRYHGETPDFMLGQDMVRFGKKKNKIWTVGVLTPRAKVTGTVTIDGKPFEFDGKGYFDHGRANVKVPDFSRWWYVLRILDDDFSLGAMKIVLKDDYEGGNMNVLHLTLGDEVIANSGAVTITQSGGVKHARSGIVYPDSYEVFYENGTTKLTGTIKFDRMVEGMNVLDRLSSIVRNIVKAFYTDPWQFRVTGTADLTLEHNGETRKITSPAIGEVHHYK